jgi:hypothetical protein
MAIKGKRKPKPKPTPRAPRREPVAPPTPFLRRTWVQLTAGFLLGVFAMLIGVWVTNNLRADDEQAAAGADAAARRTAANEYRSAVRGTFGQVGVVEPGLTPTVFVEMDAAIDGLAEGEAPASAEATFRQSARDAAAARTELASFDVTAAVADRGFDPVAVTAFTNSAATLTRALEGYRRAAQAGAVAVAVGGDEGRRLAELAVDLRDAARAELELGWTQYLQALRAGGIPELPAADGIVPELPGAGG